MKDTEFKKLIEGKDLSKVEDFNAVLKGINDESNSVLSKRDESIDVLKKENEALKAKTNAFDTEKEELVNKNKDLSASNDLLEKQKFVYKKYGNTINDEDVNDIVTFASAKKGVKFEDEVDRLAGRWGWGAIEKANANIPIPSAPKANQLPLGDTKIKKNGITREEGMAWLGLGQKKTK